MTSPLFFCIYIYIIHSMAILDWRDKMQKKILSFVVLFFLLSSSFGYAAIGGVRFYPARILFNAKPGETNTASVTVVNQRKKPISIEIEKKDYYITPDGKVSNSAPGTVKGGCSEFLSISPQKFDLEPGKRTAVRISINMPAGSNGTYWANIYMNDVSKRHFMKKDMGKKRYVKIFMDYSWEVRVYETVPGTEIKSCSITDMQITPASEEKPSNIAIEFENTGNTILRCKGRVEIRDEDGQTIRELLLGRKGKFGSLPYGKRVVEAEILEKLRPGDYVALTIIDYGGEELVAGELEFEVKCAEVGSHPG